MPPISSTVALQHVLTEVELFKDTREIRDVMGQIQEAGFGREDGQAPVLKIGIKKLLSLIEMARQEPDSVAFSLVTALMGFGM